jgi:hypothetical protein
MTDRDYVEEYVNQSVPVSQLRREMRWVIEPYITMPITKIVPTWEFVMPHLSIVQLKAIGLHARANRLSYGVVGKICVILGSPALRDWYYSEGGEENDG